MCVSPLCAMPAGIVGRSCGECSGLRAAEMRLLIEKWYPLALGLVAFGVEGIGNGNGNDGIREYGNRGIGE